MQAIAAGVFPAASVEVGATDGPHWCESFGSIGPGPEAAAAPRDTLFDLASLTKVIATTSVLMRLSERGLPLDARVAMLLPAWRGPDRDAVTVTDLLEHTSGLPPRLPHGTSTPVGRAAFEAAICATSLAYEPRTQSVYSDLDFILLGLLAEHREGAHLDALFAPLADAVAADGTTDVLTFHVGDNRRARTASTEPLPDDPRGTTRLTGDVHDGYAAALGGVAGHAGLFGNASGVGAFARTLLAAARGATSAAPFSPELVRRFVTKSIVPGSSRALGWDTMLPTSSCGTRMSPAAFGHVGFTGTSLWIDPGRDRYFVLLTNRACGGGGLETMRLVRRAFHDALGEL